MRKGAEKKRGLELWHGRLWLVPLSVGSMSKTNLNQNIDFAIIGGGIAGIVFLKEALQRGHKALLFEKASEVGGLWRDAPPWQDVQTRTEDWSINGLPIEGVDQKSIQKNIAAWVEKYDLSRSI